jgi:UDP-2-acetamido-3-amino-2,3-dideoxy-glucuronate N-acetyltransferase
MKDIRKGGQMKNKQIAVVGSGNWGKNIVRNFFELGALKAICDSDAGTLERIGSEYPGIARYSRFQDVLADASLDAVAIATPAVTHHDLAKQAMIAGKDVFVEKPIALHDRDGEELVELSRKHDRILMVGHILEYHPAIRKIKNMIDSGELGNIQYIYSNRLNLGKFRTEENILWSFAPHDISVILYLMNETPSFISAHGGNYINRNIADVTVTNLTFPSGTKAHIFVSWLHPYKEQKLVIIGGKNMIMFNDLAPENKLLQYHHKIEWVDRVPTPRPEEAEPIPVEKAEPLREECRHFLECVAERRRPQTDGANGLRVLKVLERCQESLKREGVRVPFEIPRPDFFIHESSYLDDDVQVGKGTRIWHFSHVLANSVIGENCSVGQNVVIGPNVRIGNNVKIQNNVSIYDGVTLEDDVFCGPSMVFTNVTNPRSHWPRKDEYKPTPVGRGASIGANSTVVCGHRIGKYAFVGAGALVSRDVPDYALVLGVPARVQGWMCYCGTRLELSSSESSRESAQCPLCGRRYSKDGLTVTETTAKS